MRGNFLALLGGAGGVAALSLPSEAPQVISSVTPSIVPTAAPNSEIPVFVTRNFPLQPPESALASLQSAARESPSAITFLPGVPVPSDLVGKVKHVVEDVADEFLGLKIPNPTKPMPVPAKADAVVEAAESTTTLAECTNPATRYQWGNLTDQHKSEYVAAIKCLMTKPAQLGFANAKTRWDDITVVHQQMSNIIHNVGQFLGWHRYFVHVFQGLLNTECGYTGPLPWWDETRDAGDFNGAAPFTDQYEGHMPDGNTVCIISGVFNNTELRIGPGGSDTNHCLSRGVNEQTSASITSSFVNTCNSWATFENMNNCVFFGPHAYGHDAIGGVMSDVQTSPGDPAFFLHHGFVDRNYRIWQRTDPGPRTYAIGGNTTQNCVSNCKKTTLGYELNMMGLAPTITLDQVMDTEGSFLCYKYDY